MKYFLCFFCCFYSILLTSQTNQIEGFIVFDEEALQGVSIINQTKNTSTISNEIGFFEIKASLADTIYFSYLGMQEVTRYVTSKELEAELVKIKMYEKSFELKEVEVTKYSSVNAVALGIIPEEMKEFSQYERKLANAGDFKPIHLLDLITKGALPLDPIFNAINGRTKRMKHAINLEQKQEQYQFLETNYTEYAQVELNIKEEQVGLFFTYIVENEDLAYSIKNHEEDKFRFFLMEQWNTFKGNKEKQTD